MRKRIVRILEVILSIPVACIFIAIVALAVILIPIGMLLEDLNCWAQKKAGEK